MYRRAFLILGLLLCFQGFAQSQIDTLALKWESSLSIDALSKVVAKDMYDNTYVLKEQTLSKIGKRSTSNYISSSNGELSSIDLANPLAPVLLYGENQVAVLLNRDLLPSLQVSFKEKFPNQQAVFMGANGQNRLWIVDKNNQGSVYIYNVRTLERRTVYRFTEEQDMASMKFYSSSMYLFFIDNKNTLRAIDSNGNIVLTYVFDQGYDNVFIINVDKVIYSKDDNLYYVDLKQDKVFLLDVQQKSILSFFYTTGKLSIFTPEKLNNYLLKLP